MKIVVGLKVYVRLPQLFIVIVPDVLCRPMVDVI